MKRMKWKCENCGEILSQQDVNKDYTDGGYRGEPHYTCPHCGSDELNEAYQCEICGEWFGCDEINGSVGQMVCDECMEKKATADNVVDFGFGGGVDVELNEFLATVFSAGEINDLLIEAFRNMPEKDQREKISDYIDDNKTGFAEFLTA